MRLSLPKFITAMWERNSSGDNFYDLLASGEWGIKGSNLEIAQNHPILTPALLFVSKLFSQAEFQIQNKRTGKIIKDHWLIKILENPNFYQTGPDFLESLLFMQIAQGKAVVYVKKDISFGDVEALYLLNSDLIEWPEEFKTKKLNRSHDAKIKAAKIKYDADGENLDIKIGDLMFFYDLPNGLDKNAFDTRSRLDGLKQTLINTHDSLLAKNIILDETASSCTLPCVLPLSSGVNNILAPSSIAIPESSAFTPTESVSISSVTFPTPKNKGTLLRVLNS